MIFGKLIFLIVFLISPLVVAGDGRAVAVPNPGFEGGDVVPEDWAPTTSDADAVFIWDQALARSGQRSLYLRNYGPRWAIWRSSQIPVGENTRYRLDVWARIVFDSSVSSSRLYLRVRKGRWTAVDHVASGEHGDWRRYSLEFTTGEGIDSLTIELSNLGGQGTEVWFDDVALVELVD